MWKNMEFTKLYGSLNKSFTSKNVTHEQKIIPYILFAVQWKFET